MTRWIAAAALAALTVASAAAAPAKRAGAAAPRDWSRTVVATPEGGFRMGNPNAAVKVVEYGSLTCPHCAVFSEGTKGKIAERVRTGKVSFEFRNMVLNGVDAAATLVARCAPPAQFFPFVERVYATQGEWIGRFSSLSAEQKQQIQAMPEGQRLGGVADAAGITQLAAQHGIPAAKSKACLTDPAGLKRIGEIYEAAAKMGVQGTPTFFVNGNMVPVHDWATLDAELRKAGG